MPPPPSYSFQPLDSLSGGLAKPSLPQSCVSLVLLVYEGVECLVQAAVLLLLPPSSSFHAALLFPILLPSISAIHLSVASAPYVLVLHGLTRWHSLSWLIDRWPPPRSTLGIGSIPPSPLHPIASPMPYLLSSALFFLYHLSNAFVYFPATFPIMVMKDIAFPSSKN